MSLLTTLKGDLDRSLEECLSSCREWQRLSSRSPEVFARVKAFVFSNGKRLRPLLFSLVYRGYAQRPAPGELRVALALELLHSFVLIHDDIVDRSAVRRVEPSLHRRLAADLSLVNPRGVRGEDLALVSGDVLYALALHLYQTADLPADLRDEGMACLTEAAMLTGQGELLELLATLAPPGRASEQQLCEIYDLKTAHYTFCCPMELGAVLGGAPAEDRPRLREIGLLLGRAYQVSDDLAELNGDDPCQSDFAEKRYTLLVHWALERLPEVGRRDLLAFLAEPASSDQRIREIQSLLAGSSAELHARRRIDGWLEEARSRSLALALTDTARRGLDEVIDHIGAAAAPVRA